ALKAALTADPDGSGPIKPIPTHWWQGTTQILAVQIERQERKPDGSWADATPVIPIPGRLTLVPDLEKPIPGSAFLKELVKIATDSEEQVRRPEYYAQFSGEEWQPPSEKLAAAGQAANAAGQITSKQRELEDLDKRIKAVQEQIDKLGQNTGQPT